MDQKDNAGTKKEKRRWSFGKFGRSSGDVKAQNPVPAAYSASMESFYTEREEQSMHAIAVAVATTAAADSAAVTAAQATAVRLQSQGRGTLFNGIIEKWAAVKIQTAFRRYLERLRKRTKKRTTLSSDDRCWYSRTAYNTPRYMSYANNTLVTPAKSLNAVDGVLRRIRNMPSRPNYMEHTRSSVAKVWLQSAPKQRPELAGPRKRMLLNEVVESRASLSGVGSRKSCSQAPGAFNFKSAVVERLDKSVELGRDYTTCKRCVDHGVWKQKSYLALGSELYRHR